MNIHMQNMYSVSTRNSGSQFLGPKLQVPLKKKPSQSPSTAIWRQSGRCMVGTLIGPPQTTIRQMTILSKYPKFGCKTQYQNKDICTSVKNDFKLFIMILNDILVKSF